MDNLICRVTWDENRIIAPLKSIDFKDRTIVFCDGTSISFGKNTHADVQVFSSGDEHEL